MQYTDDLFVDFIEEAREIIDALDLGLVNLEKNPEDEKNLGNIFRAIHTLKGSSGFFALKRIEKISHNAESVLGLLRDKKLDFNLMIIGALLKTNDVLRSIIDSLENHKIEPEADDTSLITELRLSANLPVDDLKKNQNSSNSSNGSNISNSSTATDEIDTQDETNSLTFRNQETSIPVKVSVDLINKLMNNVSEMVLARNRLLPFTQRYQDKELGATVSAIDKLTIELQEKILKTRMQPIGQIWMKMPRLARDVAIQCGKEVELDFKGEETELDRTLLDTIRDPLMHIVRNSIDHGIEKKERRLQLGKSEIGRIKIIAYYQNSMVVIEINDDGSGIDIDLIKKNALEKKLITADQLNSMDESDFIDLIFLPGFSTRSEITNVSGRGVGMDVVKTNITSIGGSIEVQTQKGIKTSFKIKIPLTLAIMSSLFIKVKDEQYAILQVNIQELVRHQLSLVDPIFEDFCGVTVFRLREQLIPLIFLNQKLNLSTSAPKGGDLISIVIIRWGGIRFGLIVDEILKIQEVVIKPLPIVLRESSFFSGATILETGRVSLILDVEKLAFDSKLTSKIEDENTKVNIEFNKKNTKLERKIKVILFNIEGLGLSGISIDSVTKFEKISTTTITRSGKSEFIKYENQLLPILHLTNYFNEKDHALENYFYNQYLSIIVVQIGDVNFAVVVEEIFYISEISENLFDVNPVKFGILGFAMLNEKIINVINIKEITDHFLSKKPQTILPITEE